MFRPSVLFLFLLFGYSRQANYCPCEDEPCETLPSNFLPDAPEWSMHFDNFFNSGLEHTLDMTVSSHGELVNDPIRGGGKVLRCSDTPCVTTAVTVDQPTAQCLENLDNCANDGVTVSFWAKILTSPDYDPLTAPTKSTYIVRYDKQGLAMWYSHQFKNWNVSITKSNSKVLLNFPCSDAFKWHHYLARYHLTDNKFEVFKDGQLMAEGTPADVDETYAPEAPTFFTIVDDADSGSEDFWVDNFRVWNRPLTNDNITQNYVDEKNQF